MEVSCSQWRLELPVICRISLNAFTFGIGDGDNTQQRATNLTVHVDRVFHGARGKVGVSGVGDAAEGWIHLGERRGA